MEKKKKNIQVSKEVENFPFEMEQITDLRKGIKG